MTDFSNYVSLMLIRGFDTSSKQHLIPKQDSSKCTECQVEASLGFALCCEPYRRKGKSLLWLHGSRCLPLACKGMKGSCCDPSKITALAFHCVPASPGELVRMQIPGPTRVVDPRGLGGA